MSNKNLCPICGQGQLHGRVELEESEYKGKVQTTPLYFSECDSCGSETATAEQTRRNKRVMIAFKKQVDGLLTGAEVRAIRDKLGISQAEAADAFGGGPVAFSKYENDDVMQSEAMDKLLRLADSNPEILGFVSAVRGSWEDAEWGKGKHNRCNRDIGEPFVSLNNNAEFIEWELTNEC